ncbi:retrotransposon hot spot (RHS) protein, putative [Trypanosoma cruzi marinkellei]|uniref:Retrotransposon hot spot (RHS) protein, putative n=1 Tax=Trypanosoma cruzi marinkellei TaxID=85056 RepID=K2MRR6_TRYCR|nr:retrotransposon hot spot (RHS) protein, putative [Trypanosoma cruzi marinkellei]
MPPKLNRVQGVNAKIPASAVPQGDPRRRARQELVGDTDQPAATCKVVRKLRRPKLTMSSTVEDVLLEGSTSRTNMKLNDFIRRHIDPGAAVVEIYNVPMEAFFQKPDAYVKDKQLVVKILNLDEYKVLKDIYRLHRNRIYTLALWKEFRQIKIFNIGSNAKNKLDAAVNDAESAQGGIQVGRRRGEVRAVATINIHEPVNQAESRFVQEETQLEVVHGNSAVNVVDQGRQAQRGTGDGVARISAASGTAEKGEALWPQWTMSSTVEEILLEGSTNRHNMKLNDFLRSNVGGRAAVDEDHNVTMEVFVQEPDAYVQDQNLLRMIFNLTEYQVYKLHHEGVVSLEEWRDYERKDTVTPFAKGKINRVLTQVQIEEKKAIREEEERTRREEEERLRRTQEMKFTISTTIEDVLFRGEFRYKEVRLNEFLKRELDGRGVVDTNRNVLLGEFFKDPARYIRDAGVLNEIQTSDAYLRMEIAVRHEAIFEEDVRKLLDKSVNNLLGWSKAAAEVKEGVHNFTKNSLDAALEELRRQTTEAAIILEGLYESVYNAKWHHVVELPGGEKQKTGTGMVVKEGEPPHSWTYKAVGDTLEKDDGAEQSGAAPPRLMVLTSDKGWPYTLNAPHGCGNDLCVNCEVDRVWQIVRKDIAEWFSNFDLSRYPSPMRRVLIGTPGIGKSMAAGSYLLYQLLHYDVEKLQVVVHCFGETAYVFDKIAQTVTKCKDKTATESAVDGLWLRGMKGYIIYDVAKKGTPPDTNFAPASGWGMIVVSSPKVSNYDEWAKQLKAKRIIMNCPDEVDVKAMCAWMKRDVTKDEQANYWKMVKTHMDEVGPIPRYIFDETKYIGRSGAVQFALYSIKELTMKEYFSRGGELPWYSEDPFHELVKIIREIYADSEIFFNEPICVFTTRKKHLKFT